MISRSKLVGVWENMFLGIGHAVPFSFLGIVLAFAVFSVALLIIVGIQQILKVQKFIW